MSALPYMPLYVADYLSDTADLSTLENGAYLLLIMNYWQRGNALPGTDTKLARIARLSPDEWGTVKCSLMEFFEERDGLWFHKRIEAELAHVRDKSAKASSAGKASAQRRANERPTDVEPTFNHTDTDTDTDKEETPIAPKGAGVDYPAVVKIWNELAAETKIPSVQNLTDQRKTKIRQRLSDLGGMEGFHALCGKIRGSPFLRGDNAQRFTATFDWVLKPANMTKIMEGNYDAKLSKANGHGPSKAERATARSRAELAEAIRIAEAQEAGQRAGSGGQGSELLS